MQPLSAIDALSPAFHRTHELLFRPFRIGRTWKLAVSQYLGLMGAFFVPFPLIVAFLPLPLTHDLRLRIVLFTVIAVSTLLLLVLFCIGVRMQFVNLEMIITRQQFIAPMWRRYSQRIWPVVGFKVVLGTLLYLLLLPLFWRAGRQLFQFALTLPANQPGQPPDPQLILQLFSRLIGFYVLILLAFLIFKAFSTVFEDFALPFYALEPIPLLQAARRGLRILLAEPLQCLLYLALKLLLSIAGFVAQYVSNLIVMIPVVIIGAIFAAIGVGISAATHGAGDSGHLIFTLIALILYLAFLAAIFWYQLGSLGYVFTVLEAYALYFLAGRYPLLASLLAPDPTQPFTPPPVFPSPEENSDDTDPPFPMDPALA